MKSRIDSIRSILSRISSRSINVNQLSLGGRLIFAVSSGHERGVNFTEWRLITKIESITASYYEIWDDHGKGKYYLDRSYFHLYKLDSTEEDESEYVLLHCDASEPLGIPHSAYKQSPHIHIKAAPNPLPKAHIALYNNRADEILQTIDSFDKALNESIQLFDSQILQLHI